MCDPLTAVALVGSAVSAGAGLYESQQQEAGLADVQNKQNQANAQWVAYQTQIHQQQVQAEDEARQKATSVQQATLQKVSPAAQEASQTTEQQRLNTLYNKPAGTATDASNPSNLLLSGENSGNQTFMDSLTSQVNQATAQARSRIAALATANSYGGSFGGLGTTVPITFAQGGNDINLQNAIRQGNLKTYGVQQQVQPLQYAIGPGTEAQGSIAKGAMSLAGSLASFGGPRAVSSAGSLFGGGGSTGVGSGYSFDPSSITPSAPSGYGGYIDDSMFA
jgi:hypothetical protein